MEKQELIERLSDISCMIHNKGVEDETIDFSIQTLIDKIASPKLKISR